MVGTHFDAVIFLLVVIVLSPRIWCRFLRIWSRGRRKQKEANRPKEGHAGRIKKKLGKHLALQLDCRLALYVLQLHLTDHQYCNLSYENSSSASCPLSNFQLLLSILSSILSGVSGGGNEKYMSPEGESTSVTTGSRDGPHVRK